MQVPTDLLKMSSTKSFTFFFLFLVMLSFILMSEAGTIHSSLGTGDTKSSWKPGGKRAFNCLQIQSEALFSILETVKEEVQKISNCERISLEDKSFW